MAVVEEMEDLVFGAFRHFGEWGIQGMMMVMGGALAIGTVYESVSQGRGGIGEVGQAKLGGEHQQPSVFKAAGPKGPQQVPCGKLCGEEVP